MEYKKTAEYAFDILEHFYHLHKNDIEQIGKDKITIMLPLEIYKLLETTGGDYPSTYRGMELKPSSGSLVIFALK